MKPNIPIALGAGLIATIVFVSASTGPTVARILMLALVTLPIALAGFSYNATTAFLAAAVGTVLIALLASISAGLAFALTLAFPAAFLVYLALLHREGEAGDVHWYPIGRVVIAACLMGATIVSAGLLIAGTTASSLRAAIRSSIDAMLKSGFGGLPGSTALSEADLVKATDMMLNLLPGVSAAFWMACILGCQYLAARVAGASGRLPRPWPDLTMLQFPHATAFLLGGAATASLLLDGVPRLIAMSYAGALYTGYVLLGLAIIHHLSRGQSWRSPALSALYVILFVFYSGGTLLLALLGLSDTFKPWRGHKPTA